MKVVEVRGGYWFDGKNGGIAIKWLALKKVWQYGKRFYNIVNFELYIFHSIRDFLK